MRQRNVIARRQRNGVMSVNRGVLSAKESAPRFLRLSVRIVDKNIIVITDRLRLREFLRGSGYNVHKRLLTGMSRSLGTALLFCRKVDGGVSVKREGQGRADAGAKAKP